MKQQAKQSISLLLAVCMILAMAVVPVKTYAATSSTLTNHYYYLQLKDAEKKIYDKLDAMALSYFTDKKDATEVTVNNVKRYRTDTINCGSGFSKDDLQKLVAYYLWENPIYYFLMNDCYYAENADGTKEVAFYVYPTFRTGNTRSTYTSSLVSRLNSSFVDKVKNISNDYDRVAAIHELLLSNLSINKDLEGKLAYGTAFDDAQYYSYSVYSTLMVGNGTSVGYAKLFYLLCTLTGTPVFTVSSDNHAWNIVQVGSTWYHADVAWDEMNQNSNNQFFLISGNDLLAKDTLKSHVPASMWSRFTYPQTPSTRNASSQTASTKGIQITIKSLKNSAKGKVKVTWYPLPDELEDELVEYRIQRKTGSGSWKTIKKTTKSSFTDKTVKKGKTYKYRVTAILEDTTKASYGSAKSIKVKK